MMNDDRPRATMARCPSCQGRIVGNAAFCGACGTTVATFFRPTPRIKCSACIDPPTDPNRSFCPRCGRKYHHQPHAAANPSATSSKQWGAAQWSLLLIALCCIVLAIGIFFSSSRSSSEVEVSPNLSKELHEITRGSAQAIAAANASREKQNRLAEGGRKAEAVAIRTRQLGGNGGSPYTKADPQLRPVLGARIVMGDWMGHWCIRQIDPLYDPPANSTPKNGSDVLAKPGYALGGLVVNMPSISQNGDFYAAQLVFLKLENGKLDPADSYRSAWIGMPSSSAPKMMLGGRGETVIGFFGRQGLNNDAIGLLLTGSSGSISAIAPGELQIENMKPGELLLTPSRETFSRLRNRLAQPQVAEIGTTRTIQLGGNGGSPFVRIDPQQRAMVGVRVTMGSWGGRDCVRSLMPLYERPADAPPGDAQDVLGEAGYFVSGLVVNTPSTGGDLYSMQIIFSKLDGQKLNVADTYRGPWLGQQESGIPKIVLGHKGDLVVGLFGRQGLNADAIGLILKDPTAKPEPSKDEINADDLKR